MIRIKRVYEPWVASDDYRVLVDRIWPRGLRKEDAHLDEWLREISPSTALRKWFGHDPERWSEFIERYRLELSEPACVEHLARLRDLGSRRTLTILHASREKRFNNAVAIAQQLGRR